MIITDALLGEGIFLEEEEIYKNHPWIKQTSCCPRTKQLFTQRCFKGGSLGVVGCNVGQNGVKMGVGEA